MKTLTSKPKPKGDFYDEIIRVPNDPMVEEKSQPVLYMPDGTPLKRKIGF